ncbi:MAG: TRAP transporter fused permease subunit [Syntrophaceae bacterium]|nr:TRAP transporter fused permease subunit [Syntrophaceae bacterium]
MRTLSSPLLKTSVRYFSAAFALLFLCISGPFSISSQGEVGSYLLFSNILCLILYPAWRKRSDSKLLIGLDFLLVILTAATILYWIFQYPEYASQRVGLPNQADMIFGVIMILLSLETTRRVMGNTLPILGIVFLTILYFGPYLPDVFQHKGFSLARIVEFTYSTTEGIFGTVTSTFSAYVMPFLIFGAFLQRTGGGDFFMDLAKSIAGRFAGGPALMAVWTSCCFGMISGSPIANVMTTGTFTIPLMKKMGFKPEFAGAVEAAASTGGQFMPPIMGAGAFLMATITETPYYIIMIMAIAPALLYYLSLTTMVYFRAKRRGFAGLALAELPDLKETMRKGWYYLLVLVLVTALLLYGLSVPWTAFGCTIFLIFCSLVRRQNRMTWRTFVDTLEEAAKSSLIVGATAGTLGIVMGGITLSGLGVKFSTAILAFSQGSLFLSIVLVAVIATILGMGLPTTAAYIVMAIIAAPSLIQLGLTPIIAHMLCFWLSMGSNVTPPVALAAIAASGIAKSDPMKTGVHAFVLAIYMYIIPFAFAYAPQITLLGYGFLRPLEMISTLALATFALGGAVQGWLFGNLVPWQRVVLLASTVLLGVPEIYTDLAGFVLLAAIAMLQLGKKKGGAIS